jgi:integrase/recombinase XerD
MTLLSDVARDFLRHCRYEKNLSGKTLSAYAIDLQQLADFLSRLSHSQEIALITRVELRGYLESIASRQPKTIKRKIATVKALFNYLEYEDRIVVNPFRKMRIQLKDGKRLPIVMSIAEVSKILSLLYKQKDQLVDQQRYSYLEAVRNIAIVELLFTTGARVSEIADLRQQNVDLKVGSITIKGKGNKERILHIYNPESLSILHQYRKLAELAGKLQGDYFFVNRRGTKTSDQSIRHLVKKMADKAGLSKRITPHVFRHSFATMLLEKDVDIKYIQSLLGHSSILTTQIYTHVTKAKQRQILKAKHPRRDLVMVQE